MRDDSIDRSVQGGRAVAVACLGGLVLLFSGCEFREHPAGIASDRPADKHRWSDLDLLPDFSSGIWEIPMTPAAFAAREPPSFTPVYAARVEAFVKAEAAGSMQESPSAACVPPGMPGIMWQPYPLQILFSPSEVVIQQEAYMQVRHIYTDGRQHPTGLTPTFNGHSIGHWEGQLLVVDTTGFVTETPMGAAWGTFHSDRMHIVERFRLLDADTLEVSTTIDDSRALTKPWTTVHAFKRHRDWDIAEYICEQNNRNGLDDRGNSRIDLQPPQ